MTKKPARLKGLTKTHPRRVMPKEQFEAMRDTYEHLAQKACYMGIYYHKKNPGAFGLKPGPYKPDKSLCDTDKPPLISSREEAQNLLSKGIQCGLISADPPCEDTGGNPWPRHVWAVTESGVPLEASYDGREEGTGYHGYPLPDENTPLYDEILKRWPQ